MIEKDGFHFMIDINQIPIELVFDSLEKFKDAKDYMRNHKFPGAAFSWGYPYNNIDFLSVTNSLSKDCPNKTAILKSFSHIGNI